MNFKQLLILGASMLSLPLSGQAHAERSAGRSNPVRQREGTR